LGVSARRILVSVLAGILLIVATESRSGFGVGLAIAVAAAMRFSPRRWKWLIGSLVALLGVVIATITPRLSTFLFLTGPAENVLSRGKIALIAWHALWIHPWTGLGNGIAESPEIAYLPTFAVPTHSHNVWLEIGLLYGIPAMISAVLITIIALRWVFQNDRLRRSILIFPALLLSMTDVTTLGASIALPLILGAIVLNEEARPPPASQ